MLLLCAATTASADKARILYDILQYQINETNTAIENLIKEGSIRAEDLHLESSFKEAKDHYWKTDRPELEARLSR